MIKQITNGKKKYHKLAKHMRRIERIHFVGIGGAGMSGIAEVMINLGYQVSGSDISESFSTKRLQTKGADIFINHHANNITKADVVVRSTAISDDNPEIIAAHTLRTPVISRAEMLAEIMRYRFGIAVSGTHGKTTTTSILASLLGDVGIDPTFVIGGILNSAGTSAKLGQSDYLIAEADESDTSFLHLTPMMTIVSNIDADHLEAYDGDFRIYRRTFIKFLHRMPFYGLAIVCLDDPQIRKIIDDIGRPLLTYGTTEDCDIYAKNIRIQGMSMYFDVILPQGDCYAFTLNMPGHHNVLNALSCIAAALEIGVDIKDIQHGIANFSGVDRRFTFKGNIQIEQGQVPIFEDYGHHPKELSVVLSAAKSAFPNKNIVCIFQPHRFSRTRDLFDDFVEVLSQFDKLILTEVYAAGEECILGADSRSLARSIRVRGKINPIFVKNLSDIAEQVLNIVTEKDVILVMGAGSIGNVVEELVMKNSHD